MFTPWMQMWGTAFTLLALFKWWSWNSQVRGRHEVTHARCWAYFLAWPGLDADRFCESPRSPLERSRRRDWLTTLVPVCLGVALVWGASPRMAGWPAEWSAAAGFVGLVLLVHFGLFRWLALYWQSRHCDARPIMDSPLKALSLGEFWGRRWNRAYRRVSHDLFFRPVASRCGTVAATLASFLASGALHELVITLPAGGGYGGPTAYFLIQGVGLLMERTAGWKRWIARSALTRWLWTAAVVVGPVGWLFPAPFLNRVIAPFLCAIGA